MSFHDYESMQITFRPQSHDGTEGEKMTSTEKLYVTGEEPQIGDIVTMDGLPGVITQIPSNLDWIWIERENKAASCWTAGWRCSLIRRAEEKLSETREVLGKDRNEREVRRGDRVRCVCGFPSKCKIHLEEEHHTTGIVATAAYDNHGEPAIEDGCWYVTQKFAELVTDEKAEHDFREGDRVRITSGTFAGAIGVVTRDIGDTHCVPVKLDREDFYPRRMPPENVERITDEKAERAETGWCESCQDSAAKCECGLVAENEYAGILESLSRALARPTRAQRYQLFRRAVTSAVSKQPTMRAVTDYVSGNFVAWITAPLAGEKRFLVPEGRDVNYLTLAEQWVWDMAELVRVVAGARVLGKREKDSERDQRIADAHARWLA